MAFSSSHAAFSIPAAEVDAMKAELNTYSQDIKLLDMGGRSGRGARTEEAAKCIQNFIQFFETRAARYGAHPQQFLGQHVCCNVLFIVLETIVKPSFTDFCQYVASDAYDAQVRRAMTSTSRPSATAASASGRSGGRVDTTRAHANGVGATAAVLSYDYRHEKRARGIHQNIARPFRQLVQILHRGTPMEPTTASLLLLTAPLSGMSVNPTASTAQSLFSGGVSGLSIGGAGGGDHPSSSRAGAGAGGESSGGSLGDSVDVGLRPSALFDVYLEADAATNAVAAGTLPLTGESGFAESAGAATAFPPGALSSTSAVCAPPSAAVLLFKQAAPLLALLHHIREVLQSVVLAPLVGLEYALLLSELLDWSGYVQQLPRGYLVDVSDRLMDLLERTEHDDAPASTVRAMVDMNEGASGSGGGSLVDFAVPPRVEEGIGYAQLLVKLLLLPQFTGELHGSGDDAQGSSRRGRGWPQARPPSSSSSSSLPAPLTRGERGNAEKLMQRLVRLADARHQHPTRTLKLEATLLCALRSFSYAIQFEYPRAARQPLSLAKRLADLSLLPDTRRRDVWRLELYGFLTQQLCIHFDDVLGYYVLRDVCGDPDGGDGDAHAAETTRFNMRYPRRPRLFTNEPHTSSTGGHEESREASREPADTGGATLDGSGLRIDGISPDTLRLLHETLYPLFLRVYSQPRQHMSFVSRRELLVSPCPATGLRDMFEYGSLVVYLTSATATAYGALVRVVAGGRCGAQAVLSDSRGMDSYPHSSVAPCAGEVVEETTLLAPASAAPSDASAVGACKRGRLDGDDVHVGARPTTVSPLHSPPPPPAKTATAAAAASPPTGTANAAPHDPSERLLALLRALFFIGPALGIDDTGAGESAAHTSSSSGLLHARIESAAAAVVPELDSEGSLYLLHVLAQPATVLHFSGAARAALVEGVLLPVLASPLGGRLAGLLLAALHAALTPSPPARSARGKGCGAAACSGETVPTAELKQRVLEWLLRRFLVAPAVDMSRREAAVVAEERDFMSGSWHIVPDGGLGAARGDGGGDGAGAGYGSERLPRDAVYRLLAMLMESSILTRHALFPPVHAFAHTNRTSATAAHAAPRGLVRVSVATRARDAVRLSADALVSPLLTRLEAHVRAYAADVERRHSARHHHHHHHHQQQQQQQQSLMHGHDASLGVGGGGSGAAERAAAAAEDVMRLGEPALGGVGVSPIRSPHPNDSISPSLLLSVLHLLSRCVTWAVAAQCEPALALPALASGGGVEVDVHVTARAQRAHAAMHLAVASAPPSLSTALLWIFHGSANACAFFESGDGDGDGADPHTSVAAAGVSNSERNSTASVPAVSANVFPCSPASLLAASHAAEVAGFAAFLSHAEAYVVAAVTACALVEHAAHEQQQQQQHPYDDEGDDARASAGAPLLASSSAPREGRLRARMELVTSHAAHAAAARLRQPTAYVPAAAACAVAGQWLLRSPSMGVWKGRQSAASTASVMRDGDEIGRSAGAADSTAAAHNRRGETAEARDGVMTVEVPAVFAAALSAAACRATRVLHSRVRAAACEAAMLRTTSSLSGTAVSRAQPVVPVDDSEREPAHRLPTARAGLSYPPPPDRPTDAQCMSTEALRTLRHGGADGALDCPTDTAHTTAATLSKELWAAAWVRAEVIRGVQCVQVLHLLMRFYRCGLWRPPAMDRADRSPRAGAAVRERGADGLAAHEGAGAVAGGTRARQDAHVEADDVGVNDDDDDDLRGDESDAHTFSTTAELFAAPEEVLARLSPNGQLYYLVLWLCELLRSCVSPSASSPLTLSALAMQPLIRALRFFFQDCGAALTSPRFACAEARHLPLRFARDIAQRVFDVGVGGLSRWRPSGLCRPDTAVAVYAAMGAAMDIQRLVLFALRRTDVMAMAVDDWCEPTRTREALVALLLSNGLLPPEVARVCGGGGGGAHGEQPNPSRADDGHDSGRGDDRSCLGDAPTRRAELRRQLLRLPDRTVTVLAAEWDSDRPTPSVPFLYPILASVVQLLLLLRVLFADAGSEAAMSGLLRTLFIRYRFACLPTLLHLLQMASDYAWLASAAAAPSPLAQPQRVSRPSGGHATVDSSTRASRGPAAVSEGRKWIADSLSFESALLVELVDRLLDGSRADMPSAALAVPQTMCGLLSAIYHLLPLCDALAAERLGRFSFEALAAPTLAGPSSATPTPPSVATSFPVRCHAARQVGALVHRFGRRAGRVLRELLYRCRDSILSRNPLHCATSLFALGEACRGAPVLETRVVYTLLECWATRGFAHRALLLQCLSRIACLSGLEGTGAGARPVFPQESDTGKEEWMSRDDASAAFHHHHRGRAQPYARLCHRHVRALLLRWLWRDGHPLDALPVECFGLPSVEVFLRVYAAELMPVALLLHVTTTPDDERAVAGSRAGLLEVDAESRVARADVDAWDTHRSGHAVPPSVRPDGPTLLFPPSALERGDLLVRIAVAYYATCAADEAGDDGTPASPARKRSRVAATATSSHVSASTTGASLEDVVELAFSAWEGDRVSVADGDDNDDLSAAHPRRARPSAMVALAALHHRILFTLVQNFTSVYTYLTLLRSVAACAVSGGHSRTTLSAAAAAAMGSDCRARHRAPVLRAAAARALRLVRRLVSRADGEFVVAAARIASARLSRAPPVLQRLLCTPVATASTADPLALLLVLDADALFVELVDCTCEHPPAAMCVNDDDDEDGDGDNNRVGRDSIAGRLFTGVDSASHALAHIAAERLSREVRRAHRSLTQSLAAAEGCDLPALAGEGSAQEVGVVDVDADNSNDHNDDDDDDDDDGGRDGELFGAGFAWLPRRNDSGTSLDAFFSDADGTHVYTLLMSLYARLVHESTPMLGWRGSGAGRSLVRYAALWQYVCTHWFSGRTLRKPLVLRTLLANCTNLLSRSAASSAGVSTATATLLQRVVCEVLLHVIPVVARRCDTAHDVPPAMTSALATRLTVAMVTLASESAVVASTWSALRRAEPQLAGSDVADLAAMLQAEWSESGAGAKEAVAGRSYTNGGSDEDAGRDSHVRLERLVRLLDSACQTHLLKGGEGGGAMLVAASVARALASAIDDARGEIAQSLTRATTTTAAASPPSRECPPGADQFELDRRVLHACVRCARLLFHELVDAGEGSVAGAEAVVHPPGLLSRTHAGDPRARHDDGAAAALAVLRAISMCFIEAGRVDVLDAAVRPAVSDALGEVGVRRRARVDAILSAASVCPPSELNEEPLTRVSRLMSFSVLDEALFGRAYTTFISGLYDMAFHPDPRLAAVAADALGTWLSTVPLEVLNSGGEIGGAGVNDAEIASLVSYTMGVDGSSSVAEWCAFRGVAPQVLTLPAIASLPSYHPMVAAFTAVPATFLSEYMSGAAMGGDGPRLSQFLQQATRESALACLSPPRLPLPRSAVTRTVGSTHAATGRRYSLVDVRLWQELSLLRRESVFLPSFVLAAIHSYGLDVRYRILASAVPLLECEAASAAAAAAAGSFLSSEPVTLNAAASGAFLGIHNPILAFLATSPGSHGASAPSRISATLFPVVLLHILLLKESETMRGLRAQWSEHLAVHVVARPRAFPLVTRLLLSTLHTASCVLMARTALYGLRDVESGVASIVAHPPSLPPSVLCPPPLSSSSSSAAAVSRDRERSCGSEGDVAQATETYWAVQRMLSRFGTVPAVADARETHWLSDIPAADLALAAAQLHEPYVALAFLEQSGESLLRPRGGLPGREGVPSALAALSEESSTSLAGWGAPYSILFPRARRHEYSRRSIGAGAAELPIAARGSRRELEKAEEVAATRCAFESVVRAVVAEVRRVLPLDPERRLTGGGGDLLESTAATCVDALRRREQVCATAAPLRLLVEKASALLAAGLPETALEVLLGAGAAHAQTGLSDDGLRLCGGEGHGDVFASAHVRAAAAEAAWRCSRWWNRSDVSGLPNDAMSGTGSGSSPYVRLSAVSPVSATTAAAAAAAASRMSLVTAACHRLRGYTGRTAWASPGVLSHSSYCPTSTRAASLPEALLRALLAMQRGRVRAARHAAHGGLIAVRAAMHATNWLDAVLAAEAFHDVDVCAQQLQRSASSHAGLQGECAGEMGSVLPRWLQEDRGLAMTASEHVAWPSRSPAVAGSPLPPGSFALLDDVRGALCHMMGRGEWCIKQTLVTASRALAAGQPQRASLALAALQDHVSARAAGARHAARLDLAARDGEKTEGGWGEVSDHDRVELALLHARCLHSLGHPYEAVSALQDTRGPVDRERERGRTASARLHLGLRGSIACGHAASDESDGSDAGEEEGWGYRVTAAGGSRLDEVSRRVRPASMPRAAFLFSPPAGPPIAPQVVCQLLDWTVALQLAPPTRLVRDPLLAKASSQDVSGRSSLQLARLCHRLAAEIVERVRTHAYRELRRSLAAARASREELSRVLRQARASGTTRGARSAAVRDTSGAAPLVLLDEAQERLLLKRLDELTREIDLEEGELAQQVTDYALFRRSALNAYARYLQLAPPASEDSLHAIFGFVELWLGNGDALPAGTAAVSSSDANTGATPSPHAAPGATAAVEPAVDDVDELMDEYNPHSLIRRTEPRSKSITDGVVHRALTLTPTVQFVPLIGQLVSRLGSSRDDVALTALVTRVAGEHPLLCVWPLLALANGQQFDGGGGGGGGGVASTSMRAVDPRKVSAAQQVLAALREKLRGEAGESESAALSAMDVDAEASDEERGDSARVRDRSSDGGSGRGASTTHRTRSASEAVTSSTIVPPPPRRRAHTGSLALRMITDAALLSSAYMELAYAPSDPRSAGGGGHTRVDSGFRIISDVRHLSIPPPSELPQPLCDAARAAMAYAPASSRVTDSGSMASATYLSAGGARGGGGRGGGGSIPEPMLLPTIMQYRPSFTSPGGIHAPKVITCELSDGTCARQLLKSGDDLRQDALIEQVFGMANLLFLRDANTCGRGDGEGGGEGYPTSVEAAPRGTAVSAMELPTTATTSRAARVLSVRTYNVVPLAPAVGVVQWVHDTLPLGDYLNGSSARRAAQRRQQQQQQQQQQQPPPPPQGRQANGGGGVGAPAAPRRDDVRRLLSSLPAGGAHERYFPDELTSAECRARLSSVSRDKVARHAALLELYEAYSPALHYFFLERFPSAQAFFDRRQVYTRSVAAASMVGYAVGLGDRHASNILLHEKTGEVVHIDLGIAFGQSRLLRIPELVPFRLTRNIVDGLGVRGTQGGFESACETALAVLRLRREMLTTVLSSCVYDPLARWAIAVPDPLTSRSRHDGATHEAVGRCRASAADARRTLAKVTAKLTGFDGSDRLTVASQVRKLVDAAQLTENLCVMFEGWSPWL